MAASARMAGRNVLFVMAAEAEYGPHLRRLFVPLMTGVGPVEAGVKLGAELARLAMGNSLPDLVVSLGSAGSRRLEQAQVYQAVSVAYRDMDASPLGFARGVTPFLDLPGTVPLPCRIPGIAQATLSTGAGVISGGAYDAIGEDMVDMETFAVLRACQSSACRWWRCAAFPTARPSLPISTAGPHISISSTSGWPTPSVDLNRRSLPAQSACERKGARPLRRLASFSKGSP